MHMQMRRTWKFSLSQLSMQRLEFYKIEFYRTFVEYCFALSYFDFNHQKFATSNSCRHLALYIYILYIYICHNNQSHANLLHIVSNITHLPETTQPFNYSALQEGWLNVLRRHLVHQVINHNVKKVNLFVILQTRTKFVVYSQPKRCVKIHLQG